MLSHLRRTLNEFITNETGFVRQRTGLPVAWAAGILVAAAVMFGVPDQAHASCGFWFTDCNAGDNAKCQSDCGTAHCGGVCALYSPGVTKCYCQ